MTIEEALAFLKTEFIKELDKRKELLDKIAELQKENNQLRHDLKAYRTFYPMKNEVCGNAYFLIIALIHLWLQVKTSVRLSMQS